MKKRPLDIASPLMGWHGLSLLWFALVVLLGLLTCFRRLKSAGIANMFQFDDVPLLRFFDTHYGYLYWALPAVGFALLLPIALTYWRLHRQSRPAAEEARWADRRRFWIYTGLIASVVAFVGLGMLASRYSYSGESSIPDLEPTGVIDWILVVLSWAAAYLMTRAIGARDAEDSGVQFRLRRQKPGLPIRLGTAYLLGCASVFIYAALDHLEFWDPRGNGGYDYRPFFREGEIPTANLVLYSTSLLFATVAALGGCACQLVFHRISRRGSRTGLAMTTDDCRRQAVLLSLTWSGVLGIPWQIKILEEIRAEEGWLLPGVVLVFSAAALLPVMCVSCLMLKRDFDEACAAKHGGDPDAAMEDYPRRSEFAFWTLLLFPLYPYLRMLRVGKPRVHYAVLMGLAAGLVAALTWLVNQADELFDFDDWRNMMKGSQFPFLQVFMSLVAAWFVYVFGRTACRWFSPWLRRRLPRIGSGTARALRLLGRGVVLTSAAACLVLATWPFWGWHRVNKNVFARTFEYSHRHEFDLLFLHWLLDFDRDGYSAVLHGADPDDFDFTLQPGDIRTSGPVDVPIDAFEIEDPAAARDFPNLVIFYLEGVTPRSISAYGYRSLPGGVRATPNIDQVAAEGALFTQARCFYPSTWDAWMTVNSGRFLRVEELHAARPFGNRYNRYNNLYRILELAGVDRWCHADQAPYQDLCVSETMWKSEKIVWKSNETFDSRVSQEEEEQGILRGDRRNERMLEFLDSLKPGEKFFMCEHMSDTHFPWNRISSQRAKELGIAQDPRFYENDADLRRPVTGETFREDKYSCYFQCVTRMDAQIGQILKKLKERNLYDNTMIVIVSDHGCQWWEHEHMYYVGHLYEQSLHVPLIVKVPRTTGGKGMRLGKGVVCDEPVMQMDVLPTVMELAGMRHIQADARPLPSRSLLPLMENGKVSEEVAARYRQRDILLTTHYDMLGVISDFRYKLIFDRPSGTYLLFDLEEKDEWGINEMHNLADERPELFEQMLQKLREMVDRHKSIVAGIRREEEG
ncbi:MAG TPA: sulfatase-like hydrolase/transferase [Thermoguttaceae bacterium]|nr:sulfatase-like hydrolase/transferase [Thermoguttaceae bacterium]